MSWEKIFAISFLFVSSLIVCLTFEVWAATFLGILFAISLNGPAEWIRSKLHLPAWAATSLTMLVVFVALTGLGLLIGPPIVEQADELGRELPTAVEKSLDWLEQRKWGRTVMGQIASVSGVSKQQLGGEREANHGAGALSQGVVSGSAERQPLAGERSPDSSDAGHHDDDEGSDNGDGGDQVRSMVLAILKALGKMLSVSVWTMTLLLVNFVVMTYVALNPSIYRRGILWMIPSERETVATQTMARIAIAMRWWMLGRLVSMLAVGLLTSLGMQLIGMPAPLALGALAGLLSFVPNIGPIIAAVPGLLLAVPDGPWMLLSALSVYIVAQIVESNLITPLVDRYTVATPPAVLIVTQFIIGMLAGTWGAVIASPLLVVVLVLIQQLYVREYLNRPIKSTGATGGHTAVG